MTTRQEQMELAAIHKLTAAINRLCDILEDQEVIHIELPIDVSDVQEQVE